MAMSEDTKRRLILEEKMRKWRRTNPLRRWRLKHGYHSAAAAAAVLNISPQTFAKWDCGATHPRCTQDKNSYGYHCEITVKLGDKEIRKQWDDHVAKLTGVTINEFMAWFVRRPRY